MKRGMVLVAALMLTTSLYAQQTNVMDQPYIEVSGQAEVEVVPDKIYVQITIDGDSKGQETVLQQEKEMVQRFDALGIDVEKKLVVQELFNSALKSNKVTTFKMYRLEVFRLSGRKVHIVVQIEQLLAERRVIGQNADRVFIDVQAVCGRFDRDRFSFVGNQPMQLRGGQSGAERRSGQVEPGKLCPGLLNRRAPPQQPRDELKLRDIRPVRLWLRVYGVSDEIQPRDAQALFVHRIIIERIAALHMRHADYGVVRMHRSCVVEVERVISRRDCHLFAVAAFVIQRPAKIKLLCLICDRSTHLALHSFQACVALVCAVFTG